MGSSPREWRPAAPARGDAKASRSMLDPGASQGYISCIYSLSDQPSGLRRGFVFLAPAPASGRAHAA